VVNIIICR